MKVLVTGAHFTPAVATVEQLKKYPDLQIIYVGRATTQEGDSSKSVESKVFPEMGVKFIPIITGRIQRSFTLYTIPSLLKIPLGIFQAIYIILTQRPSVILSFGGYIAIPLVFVGWLFSIPIIIHEQTLVTGLANKISSHFADKIAIAFKQNNKSDKRVMVVGNPIRSLIINSKEFKGEKNSQKKPLILITGGNQGSHIINLAIEEVLGKLLNIASIIHITGDNKFNDFERLENIHKSKKLEERYIVKKWVGDDYGTLLQKSDLVICRAGINTLTELAYLGKPALVVPIPYLYKDEQNTNARFFENLGLAEILPQGQLSGGNLLKKIRKMLNNLGSLKEKARKAKGVVMVDAAKRLALETIILAKANS